MSTDLPQPHDGSNCLTAAWEYAGRGFLVVPLHGIRNGRCTCQDWRDKNGEGPCEHPGKHPRLRGWPESATADRQTIERWFRRDFIEANVGIATGAASGVFVLDMDPKNGGESSLDALIYRHGPVPDTLQSISGGGGRHYYFRHPGATVPNGVGIVAGLDIRGDGGLVVAPPSLHVSGRRYEWDGLAEFGDTPVVPAPGWLMELMNTRSANGDKRRFELPLQTAEGERNATLYRYACSLRASGRGLDLPEILNAVQGVNQSRCKPPLGNSEVEKLVESACHHEKGNVRHASARANKERLPTNEVADTITADSHFALNSGGKLYVFQRGVYKPTGESYIKRRVKAILGALDVPQQWTSRSAEEVVKYIAVDAPELWDRPDANVVNVENGLLDVRTRLLAPHSPTFLSPVQVPVKFDPAARCPAWDRFIGEVFPEDTEALAWEIPAWLITPNTSIQKAVLLIGDGANGKSTYLGAVLAFIGKYNASAVSLHKLESDRFSVARLVGRLANICPDLPTTGLVSTSVFKAITGGDPLMAEYKFRDSFEFVPYARLIFSANQPPKSTDASPAFFRRWLVVRFERTFADGAPGTIQRDQLDAALADPAELSGVLNKALQAIAAIRARGLSESNSTRRSFDEFRQATDPLSVWLDHNTLLHPDVVTPQDQLYREYCRNCFDAGRPTITKTAFGLAMKKLRPTVANYQRTVNGALPWCYVGIGLVTKEDE